MNLYKGKGAENRYNIHYNATKERPVGYLGGLGCCDQQFRLYVSIRFSGLDLGLKSWRGLGYCECLVLDLRIKLYNKLDTGINDVCNSITVGVLYCASNEINIRI